MIVTVRVDYFPITLHVHVWHYRTKCCGSLHKLCYDSHP